MIAPQDLVVASNATVANLTNRDRPVTAGETPANE
jgi:hypothetical protein